VMNTAKMVGRKLSMAIAIASTLTGAGLDAQDRPASLRGLTGDVGMVLRGEGLDQERAPGGLWHRFRVEEVIWTDGTSSPEAGTVLRLFSHGVGLPEGGDLPIGEEVIVGATAIPFDGGETLHPFLRRLSESLRAEGSGDAAALASPDGMIAVTGDPDAADDVGRMVRSLRGGLNGEARSEMLLELAAHRLPAVRAEAVRQLGLSPALLDASTAFRAAEVLRAEAEGPAHPMVLSAHMDLLEGRNDGIGGSALVRVIRSSPHPSIARRAGLLLEALGTPADWRELAGAFGEVKPATQVSVLGALASRESPRATAVYARAMESPDRRVRIAAVTGLRGSKTPAAVRLLRGAGRDPSPEVRSAAAAALEAGPKAESSTADKRDGEDPGSLRNLLRSVRGNDGGDDPPGGNER
jgi:hypothetical protein